MIHAQFDPTARQLLAATAVDAKTRKDLSWQQIADAAELGPNLRAFSRAVAGQLVATGLDVEADEKASRAQLQAHIDAQRRERHGTPGDTSHHPPWSQASGPPGSPPEENPWV